MLASMISSQLAYHGLSMQSSGIPLPVIIQHNMLLWVSLITSVLCRSSIFTISRLDGYLNSNPSPKFSRYFNTKQPNPTLTLTLVTITLTEENLFLKYPTGIWSWDSKRTLKAYPLCYRTSGLNLATLLLNPVVNRLNSKTTCFWMCPWGVTKHRTAHTARTARSALTGRVTKYRTARTASRNTAPRRENNYRTARHVTGWADITVDRPSAE